MKPDGANDQLGVAVHMKNFVFLDKKVLLGVVLLVQGSLASASAPGSPHQESLAASSPSTEASVQEGQKGLEQALEERVNARWAALMKHDFAAAYEFQTPAYREVYTVTTFTQQFGTWANWTKATVAKIIMQPSLEESNLLTAEVVVNIHYIVPFPSMDDPTPASTSVNERWLRKEGEWWYQDSPDA
jgi:hypothetical protein